jgi:surface polysaccharide O-acyltransferase-like enzyme
MTRSRLGAGVPRSVVAIVAGFVFIAALSFGTDAVLRVTVPNAFGAGGALVSNAVLGVSLFYVALFAVTGCYLAARLAPQRPMDHALVLGVLGLAFTIVNALSMWSAAPAWYHVVSVLVVMPYAWAGGRLRELEITRERAFDAADASTALR